MRSRIENSNISKNEVFVCYCSNILLCHFEDDDTLTLAHLASRNIFGYCHSLGFLTHFFDLLCVHVSSLSPVVWEHFASLCSKEWPCRRGEAAAGPRREYRGKELRK